MLSTHVRRPWSLAPLVEVQLLSFQNGWSWLTVQAENVVQTSISTMPVPVASAPVKLAKADFWKLLCRPLIATWPSVGPTAWAWWGAGVIAGMITTLSTAAARNSPRTDLDANGAARRRL
jgi:hypothetical protein